MDDNMDVVADANVPGQVPTESLASSDAVVEEARSLLQRNGRIPNSGAR